MIHAGIDVGGTFIKYGLVDDEGNILEQHTVETMADHGRDIVIDRIINCARECLNALRSHHVQTESLEDIEYDKQHAANPDSLKLPPAPLGIGLPGVVMDGIVHQPPNLPGWGNEPLVDIIEEALDVEVVIENDANAAALAESMLGAGKDHPDFLFVTLGTGVGGGIILNNEIYRGPHGEAGEVGHIILDPRPKAQDPRPKGQGLSAEAQDPRPFRQGVLESLIGGQILEAEYGASVGDIDAAARGGDERAIAYLTNVGETLGLAMCSALAILGLRVLIIGGGISRSDIVIDATRRIIQERAIPSIAENAVVHRARFMHNTGLIGAAMLTRLPTVL